MKIKPINKEIKLKPNRFIMSVTDLKGNILRVNDYFVEISGYKESELIGSPHNIIRHPDMPKAIFYIMWESIKKGENITAVVKNLTKEGKFYWVVTDFEIRKDSNNKIDRYMAFRYAPSRKVIYTIEKLYKNLLEIEKSEGMNSSVNYLKNLLKKDGLTYNEYIKKIEKRSIILSILLEKFKIISK